MCNFKTILNKKTTICMVLLACFNLFSNFSLLHSQELPESQTPSNQTIQKQIVNEINDILTQRWLLKQQCQSLDSDKLNDALAQIDQAQLASPYSSTWLGNQARKLLVAIGKIIAETHVDMSSSSSLILLTQRNAPTFYLQAQTLCKKLSLPVPMIFMSDDENLINALALSFSSDCSIIIVGKRLLLSLGLEEIISVIAHELGHIKKHHMLKRVCALMGVAFVFTTGGNYLVGRGIDLEDPNHNYRNGFIKLLITSFGGIVAHNLLQPMYQDQEKEADQIELSITQNPKALGSSFDQMHNLEVEQLEERKKAAEVLNSYIDTQLSHVKWKAKEVKDAIWGESALIKALDNITSVQSHPSVDERKRQAVAVIPDSDRGSSINAML